MTELFELNYSKINAYSFCPFLYKYVYLDGKYAPHNAYSSFGISIHRTLEKYAAFKGDLESLFIYYEEAWKHEGYKSPGEMMEFYGRGRKLLENFWLREQESEAKIALYEKNFDFEAGKFRIKGTIDRVDRLKDGKIELIEYKTGLEERTEESLKNDRQLAIYALGLKNSCRMSPDYLSFYLVSIDKKITVPYEGGSETVISEYLAVTGEKIMNREFGAKGKCAVCQIRNLCSESESRDVS
ncbi:MAG: hypothetical protein COT17_03815 [Elusimicrobia bacterium CG08_land_8_20_14_0_20_51_18]|nr:MAG: hypothetical protein COT17_03815 [Elusimicrobia bacterium CG08_land_8_20_14_0_20_51_18]